MGARVRNFEDWEDWKIEKTFDLISNPRSEALRKEDFSASPEERQRNPELQAAYLDKLGSLTQGFRAFFRREKGVSWPQADLAAAEIMELLSGQWEKPFTGEPTRPTDMPAPPSASRSTLPG